MMDRRTLLAIAISLFLLVIYQWILSTYFPPPEMSEAPATTTATTTTATGPTAASSAATTTPTPASGRGDSTPSINLAEKAFDQASGTPKSPQPSRVPDAPVITFGNQKIQGGVAAIGGELVDMRFLDYKDQIGPEGKPVRFFKRDANEPFLSASGFIAAVGVDVPRGDTHWEQVSEPAGGKGNTLHLRWDNTRGLLFEKIFTWQPASYMLEMLDRVTNSSGVPVTLFHYAQFVRRHVPLPEGSKAAPTDFQGPMGFLHGTRVQFEYDELPKGDRFEESVGGWAGFSDKYFLAAMGDADARERRKFYFDFDAPNHRVGMVTPAQAVAGNESRAYHTRLFVGPKAIEVLTEQNMHLERSIDYGWFHFLAEPLVRLLLIFNKFVNNFGVAIILLTVVIKLLFFPLANKSYRSMSAMKKLQPKVDALRKLYGDDKQRLNQEMMKLYQENKVNPLGGCLPVVVQIPVFFALYKVLFLSVEMRHAPFMFWIQDLSDKDPYYVMPILMGISMVVQSRLSPAPADPVQAKIMMFLPVIFTVMFLTFPSGLVLYWLVNNVLSILQQGYIMRQSGG
ncbi:MAG: membrane protein insertase YidC [Magnetococcales bacterium]|nr:membrane protein insertase YidC [Magnetococcales bacterium]